MSNLQDKLAAGVRSAREDQNKDSNAAVDNASKKETTAPAASDTSRAAPSSKAAATKKAAALRKATTRKASTAKRKAPAKKTAAQSTRKAPAKRSTAQASRSGTRSTASRRGNVAELNPNKAKATADEPWKNLHPNRIWPD